MPTLVTIRLRTAVASRMLDPRRHGRGLRPQALKGTLKGMLVDRADDLVATKISVGEYAQRATDLWNRGMGKR